MKRAVTFEYYIAFRNQQMVHEWMRDRLLTVRGLFKVIQSVKTLISSFSIYFLFIKRD